MMSSLHFYVLTFTIRFFYLALLLLDRQVVLIVLLLIHTNKSPF